MMSSCCILRLKRRRAFSIDSPSWTLISAKKSTPPDYLDWVEIKRLFPRGIAEDASHALETCQANIVVALGDTPIARPTRAPPQTPFTITGTISKGCIQVFAATLI